MPMTFWAGKEPGTTHEAAARSRIIADFEQTFGAKSEPLFVVFDVSLGSADLDMVVFKTNAVIVIEIKECRHPIRGGINGKWLIMEPPEPWPELKGGSHGNPFQQVTQYRHELIRYLEKKSSVFLARQKAQQIRFDHVSAVIAISPRWNENSDLKVERSPWFHLCGLDQLSGKVREIRSSQMTFTCEELERLVRDVLHCDRLDEDEAPIPPSSQPVPISATRHEAVQKTWSTALLEEHWISCEPSINTEVALVLDASESAAEVWDDIWASASSLVHKLPPGVHVRVFFLGSPREFRISDLTQQIAAEVSRNRGRVSLIGPIYRILESSPNPRVLVAGCGRIYDLECWIHHPLFRRTRFLRFGPDNLTGGIAAETVDAEQIIQKLQIKLNHVEISARGLMAHWWDNPAYGWDQERGTLFARASAGYQLRAGFLTAAGEPFRVTAHLENGEHFEIPCQPASASRPVWNEPGSGSEERKILEQVVRGNHYNCPLCQRTHSSSETRCFDSGRPTVGRIVHQGPRELDEQSALRAFVILDTAGRWRLHACNVLRIANNKVALAAWRPNRGSAAQILRFHPESKQWISDQNDHWRQYRRLPGGDYAILP